MSNPSEQKPSSLRALPVIVATAAVTIAISVTAAALGGFLTPRRDAPPRESPVAEVTSDAPTEAAPTTVLVPVIQDAPAAAPQPDVIVAEPRERERERTRDVTYSKYERHGREHDEDAEDDHDDD